MPRGAVKVFEITEGAISGGYYRIQVKFRGKMVEEFLGKTMREASSKLERAGYRMGNENTLGFDYDLS